MNAVLYINNSDNNKVDKTLTSSVTKSVKLLDGQDQQNITLLLNHTGAFNYNYLRVADFNRYYFITNVIRETNDKVRIMCKTDVLMSFKTAIRNLTGTIARSEKFSNAYLLDENYKGVAYKQIVCKQFPNAIQNDTMYLRTLGNGGVL